VSLRSLRAYCIAYIVGEAQLRGVTQLDNIVYLVAEECSIIKTFTDTLSPLADIHVEGMRDPVDIVACRYDRQLYVAANHSCIWRVSVDTQAYVKWLPTESSADKFRVEKLSLTSRGLLVTSPYPPRLFEYSKTDKELLRVVKMPEYVDRMIHGVETTRGTFVVSHSQTKDLPENELKLAVSEMFSYYQLLSAPLPQHSLCVRVCVLVLPTKRGHYRQETSNV